MTLLLLIRHGVTDATGRKITGRTPGVHLSERGREQAGMLAERLVGVPLSAIYSSPLERCRETAEPLAAARRLRIRTRAELSEVDYGAWTNRSLSQLARTKLWRAVQQAPSAARFPGGEGLLDVQERMVGALTRIADDHPHAAVAVFSHGDPIRLALAHFAGIHADLFQRLVVEPASVSAVLVGGGIPRIARVNDTGDPADLGQPAGRAAARPPRPRKVRG